MSTTLTIRAELLLGNYQAADEFGPAGTPEWPPHPFRLHAALLAAACEEGGEEPSPASLSALRWLERQPPPHISCAKQRPRSTALAFVPRNPQPVELKRARAEESKRSEFVDPWVRNPRRFPVAVPYEPVVTYTWSIEEPAPLALTQLVERVAWLGTSRSPVACAVVGSSPDPTHSPALYGEVTLRVASPGVTDGLLRGRHEWPTPVNPPVVTYAAGRQATTQPVVTGAFAGLVVRQILLPSLAVASTAVLTAALRAATLHHAGDDAPDALHGHGEQDHAAFLGLADVGHRNATGLVRGVAMALPARIADEERAACLAAFGKIQRLCFEGRRRSIDLDLPSSELRTLRPERWIGPSRTFATVTPVILDRFPRRRRTAVDELRQSIVNAGWPDPDEVELLAGPAVRQAAQTGKLVGPLPPGLRVHVRVSFAERIRGPLLAGRARFRGVGLFLPVTDAAAR